MNTNKVTILDTPIGTVERYTHCLYCNKELTGQQRKYCSQDCNKIHWEIENRTPLEKVVCKREACSNEFFKIGRKLFCCSRCNDVHHKTASLKRKKTGNLTPTQRRKAHDKVCQEFGMWAHKNWPELRMLWYLVPNEEKRTAIRGALLKSQGLTAGVLDYCFLLNGVTRYVEVKVEKDKLSENQKAFIASCAEVGIQCITVHGKDVKQTLNKLQFLFKRCVNNSLTQDDIDIFEDVKQDVL